MEIEIYGIKINYETMRQKRVLKQLEEQLDDVRTVPDLVKLKSMVYPFFYKLKIVSEYVNIDIEKQLKLIDKFSDIYETSLFRLLMDF